MRAARLAPALLAAAVFACGGGGSGGPGDAGTEVPFTTVVRSSSAVSAREGVVARSQGEFDAVWARYHANLAPAPPPPVFDFGAVQVVGIFLGTRPNGCYAVSITRVVRTADRLTVVYREQLPAPGVGCTQALVNPSHLVTVPASRLEVGFVAE